MKLGDILHVLRDSYCRRIGIEYMHISEPAEKRWMQEHVEGTDIEISVDEKRHILELLDGEPAHVGIRVVAGDTPEPPLLVGSHIGSRHVDLRTDDVENLRGVAAREALHLGAR